MLEHVEELKQACSDAFACFEGRFDKNDLPAHLFARMDFLAGEIRQLGQDADTFEIMHRAKELGAQSEIVNGSAMAAGMNRLLDGENVKDTVK